MLSATLKLLVLASACFLAAKGQMYFQRPVRQLATSSLYGGTDGGDSFFDYMSNNYYSIGLMSAIRSITISYSDQVESIQVDYLLLNKTIYQAPRHGSVKNINPPVTIKLTSGEYVQKIEGKTNGVLVDQLTIITRKPKDSAIKKYGPYGKTGRTNYTSELGYVVAFFGRSGDMLDGIGVHFYPLANKSDVFGSHDETKAFDDNPDTGHFPVVVRIKKLFIHHASLVSSIQAQYELLDGSTRLGKKIGGGGDIGKDIETVVKFEDDEEILGIKGTADSAKLCQLTFISRRDNISNPILYNGPFGWPCPSGSPFSVQGRVLGFFGSSDSSIRGLGVYYTLGVTY